MIPIVPALIPNSVTDLTETAEQLTGIPEIHVDVVDGVFVPYRSWPYSPLGVPKEVRAYTDTFTLEVDLMVENQLEAAEAWLLAGADMLVFHTEVFSLQAFKRFTEQAPAAVSISISAQNDTPLEDLLAYLPYADGVQLMGIAKIGAQGQPFDERVLERIIHVKQAYPNLPVTVDGSVNQTTIPVLKAAGANRFICGSAITKASDPQAAYRALLSVAN